MADPTLHPLRAKLIFNPNSGITADAPARLMSILAEMQSWNIHPEVCLLGPEIDLPVVIKDAMRQGIRLFVACGGDGTVDSVASLLTGSRAVLGIIPAGTRNNVALSLGLPRDIPGAAAVLRGGEAVSVDMGVANCRVSGDSADRVSADSTGENGVRERAFLEVCSIGLVSALFPAADDVQHGNLARLGDLLATLVSFPPADMRLLLDGRIRLRIAGHVALIGNMPYVGPNYPVLPAATAGEPGIPEKPGKPSAANPYSDGLLDLLVFSSLSKLDLLGAALQTAAVGVEDPRIQRYRVKEVEIETDPPMPVMVDGIMLGGTPLRIRIKRRALTVMVPREM